jgi:hypothetical protein
MKRATLTVYALALLTLSACTSAPVDRPHGPSRALREVFRGGVLPSDERSLADVEDSGQPAPYDQVSHVCASSPVYGPDGRYSRTIVRCW